MSNGRRGIRLCLVITVIPANREPMKTCHRVRLFPITSTMVQLNKQADSAWERPKEYIFICMGVNAIAHTTATDHHLPPKRLESKERARQVNNAQTIEKYLPTAIPGPNTDWITPGNKNDKGA